MHGPLRIGKFELRLITVPEGDKPPYKDAQHVWIEHESGEGMSTNVVNVEDLIASFYREHF